MYKPLKKSRIRAIDICKTLFCEYCYLDKPFENVWMNRSIEHIARFFMLTIVAIVVNLAIANGQSDFYVSPKSCIQDQGTVPGNGSGGINSGGNGLGGGQQGGNMMPVGACDAPTTFFDTDISATAWQWDFGDGSLPATSRKVNYQYAAPGIYTATLTRTTNGSTQTISRNVLVGDYPRAPTFNNQPKTDTTVCGGSTVTLNPYRLNIPPSNVSYLWYPGGETTQTIDVDSSGCYSVEVFDNVTGCSRTAVITVNFCLQPSGGGGGGESWYFGTGATLDFQLAGTLVSNRDSLASQGGIFSNDSTLTDASFSPLESTRTNEVNTPGSSAMVYGPDGSLKFYTDGTQIYTVDDAPLTDTTGTAINLNLSPTSQGLVIIPKSACNECPHHQYYVFGVDQDTKTLSYSVIDLRYNDQQGAIIESKVPVMYPATQRIVATPNADSTGFIIIAHEAGSDKYNLITVDSSGVTENLQAIGVTQTDEQSQEGYLSISPNGRFMAVGVVKDGKNFVELYEIDRNSNPISLTLDKTIELDDAPPNIYGLAFANNSQMLYVTLRGDGISIPSRLYQLPLLVGDAADIAADKTLIDQSTNEIFGALQLGPTNGNAPKFIYMAIDGATELPYIQDPDSRGGASVIGYTRITPANQGIAIPGSSGLGFPNVVFANQQQDGDGVQATYDGNCFDRPTVLSMQEVCSPLRNEIEWIFEDGSTIKNKDASYTFPKVGWNRITLKVATFAPTQASRVASQLGNIPVVGQLINNALETKCRDTLIVDSIYIKPSPRINLTDSVYVCTKDALDPGAAPVQIDPNVEGGESFLYRWQTGTGTQVSGTDQSTAILTTIASGNYNLFVVNNFACETDKDFRILDKCEPRIFAPTVFTPNNDGLNDTFVVFVKYITNYKLAIYNRWGELIYESDNPDDKRWDGAVKGKTQAPMVYPYRITYESLDFPERGKLEERGLITVIK